MRMTFETLGLAPELLSALEPLGYTKPTQVQAKVIPLVMEGKDVVATAQTGTGKTAAYALPLLHHLAMLGLLQTRSNQYSLTGVKAVGTMTTTEAPMATTPQNFASRPKRGQTIERRIE